MPKGIMTVLIFPRPWPPKADFDLFSGKIDDSEVNLHVDVDGRFILTVHSSGEQARIYRFQPIKVEGGGRAALLLSWSEDEVSFHLNDDEVRLDDETEGKVLVLRTKNDPLPSQGLVLGNIDPNVARSEAESFFLGTVAEIDEKVLKGDRYNLIRAAGLLKQLFLDPVPLLHRVNRSYCQKIEFETIDNREPPPLYPQGHAIFLDATYFPRAKTIRLNLDAFLKSPCFRIGTETASVRDLIRACANAKGGIHLGKTRTSEEDTVLDWDRTFRLFGEEPSLLAIAQVCRVALRGLSPLVQAIMKPA